MRSKDRRSQKGAIFIEAALVLPVLVGFFFATYSLISLSRSYMSLSQIIREAVVSAAPNLDCAACVYKSCCEEKVAKCGYNQEKKECLDPIVIPKVEKLLDSYALPLKEESIDTEINDDADLYVVTVSGKIDDSLSIYNNLTLFFSGFIDLL